MLYFIVFYWLVCGLAFYSIPTPQSSIFGRRNQLADFVLSMIFGGLAIPARFLLKAVR